MNTPYRATIGPISHGTLRPADLLGAFAYELRQLDRHLPMVSPLVAEAEAVATLADAGWSTIYDSEEASELVTALQDALNERAPPYCYFGNTEGDGSDFGFWPSMDEIEELPRVADPADIFREAGTGEDCAYVNDHGNVTVYGADGTVLLDIV